MAEDPKGQPPSADPEAKGGVSDDHPAEHLPPPHAEDNRAVKALAYVQDLVYFAIAIILLGVAVFALGQTVTDFFMPEEPYAARITRVVNSVLFVIIVLEIVRTIVAHFQDAELKLKPFLIIGIISSVRHILTVGAQLSLGSSEKSYDVWRRATVELGTNALVVVALVVGLALVRKTD